MLPIIISLLLNTKTKGSKIVLPLKLLAVLLLVIILFVVQISQKVFKIGKNDALDEPTPLVSFSIPGAEAQTSCWACGEGQPCEYCLSCGELCYASCAYCQCSCACDCVPPANNPPSVDDIIVE